MQYIDDEAVCQDCGDAAVAANHAQVRANAKAWQEAERAKDPEKYDRRQAAVKDWTDKVMAAAEREPGKEWVTAPGGTPGWVKVPPEHEPPTEQEAPVAVEPGIQALMAAGLLQGQEPGGSGVCNATITDGAGKVTEVAIPVPVLDLPGSERLEENRAKGQAPPRKRASRAKPKPEPVEVPSASSAGDAPAAALARVREGAKLTQDDVALMPNPNDARLAEIAANGEGWDPQAIANDVYGPPPVMPVPAPTVDPLQAGLQSAVDSGAMTPADAAALGWVDPVLKMIVEHQGPPTPAQAEARLDLPAGMQEELARVEAAVSAEAGVTVKFDTTPRTAVAIEDFKANYANPAADIFIDALAAATSMPEEDAILGALDNLAPYEGMPGGVEEAKKSILRVIEDAITNHPRSLQKSIGPSEIGTECDHCLAAKLAGWDQVRDGSPWLPTVGTAVHTWLEECAFRRVMLDAFNRPRYLMERKVAVGMIGGVEITGSTDLVDLVRGMTWDWKIVGITTLKSAKVSPSRRYIVQQMLYAHGWRRLGVLITHVGIAYLPRNEVSLRKAVLWTAEFDESIVLEALARANQVHANLQAMESISVEARDQFITSLPRWRSWRENVGGIEKLVYGNAVEGKIECLDCARYPDYPEDPAEALKQLDGILA